MSFVIHWISGRKFLTALCKPHKNTTCADSSQPVCLSFYRLLDKTTMCRHLWGPGSSFIRDGSWGYAIAYAKPLFLERSLWMNKYFKCAPFCSPIVLNSTRRNCWLLQFWLIDFLFLGRDLSWKAVLKVNVYKYIS